MFMMMMMMAAAANWEGAAISGWECERPSKM